MQEHTYQMHTRNIGWYKLLRILIFWVAGVFNPLHITICKNLTDDTVNVNEPFLVDSKFSPLMCYSVLKVAINDRDAAWQIYTVWLEWAPQGWWALQSSTTELYTWPPCLSSARFMIVLQPLSWMFLCLSLQTEWFSFLLLPTPQFLKVQNNKYMKLFLINSTNWEWRTALSFPLKNKKKTKKKNSQTDPSPLLRSMTINTAPALSALAVQCTFLLPLT